MKKKTAARSIERPGQPKDNQSGMPYGTGSLQKRGRTYWIMYRDPEGRQIQENSRLEDYAPALRMLAERALVTVQAKVAVLEAIINETEEQEAGSQDPVGPRKKHAGSGGTVRRDAAVRRTGKHGGKA